MAAKCITTEHIADIRRRIEQGETPIKRNEVSLKEFILEMMPYIKKFLEQGYTYKEIAEFIGHVSSTTLKKAVAKDFSHAKEAAAGAKAKDVRPPVQTDPVKKAASAKQAKAKKS